MDANGILHRPITSLWPQANESETFMKQLMKAVRTAHPQKKWRRIMHEFSPNYRATPYTTLLWCRPSVSYVLWKYSHEIITV